MREKWLINVSEQPDMKNTTLDNGKILRQLIIGVSLLSGMVILASVEISEELMREIHQI